MSDSVFASLLGMLDKGSIGQIAGALGESEQSVSRGMELAIATVLSGLTAIANDPTALQKMLDTASTTFGDVPSSRLAEAVTNSGSPLISGGKRMMSSLFGGEEDTVTNALSRQAGLRPGAASTLLSMAVPFVLSYLDRRVRSGEMTVSGLSSILQRESSAIQSAMPAGLQDALRTAPTAHTASPVIGQTLEKVQRNSPWVVALGIAVLLAGLFWLFNHSRIPTTARTNSRLTGSASRAETLGDFVTRKLPNNVALNIPESGVESQLLAYIQDPNRTVERTTWFDFDRLTFNPRSATLRPESQEQIKNIAAILKAYPNVHLKIGGYTDNVGSTEDNLKLSQARADIVVAYLVRDGVSPDRLIAQAYGEQYPVGDNASEEGRAKNRRVSMHVMQK